MLPLILSAPRGASLGEWFRTHRDDVMHTVADNGAVIFRDFEDAATARDFSCAMRMLDLDVTPSLYVTDTACVGHICHNSALP